jgi:hypothetical protein
MALLLLPQTRVSCPKLPPKEVLHHMVIGQDWKEKHRAQGVVVHSLWSVCDPCSEGRGCRQNLNLNTYPSYLLTQPSSLHVCQTHSKLPLNPIPCHFKSFESIQISPLTHILGRRSITQTNIPTTRKALQKEWRGKPWMLDLPMYGNLNNIRRWKRIKMNNCTTNKDTNPLTTWKHPPPPRPPH